MRRTRPIPRTALRVRRSSAGLGLFACAPIAPGAYLEYIGPLLDNDAVARRPNGRYFFEVNSKLTIDGSIRENIARYANHACHPNCVSQQVGRRIYLVALRPIALGDELTYDYGDVYVDAHIRPDGCKCMGCTAKKKLSGTSKN